MKTKTEFLAVVIDVEPTNRVCVVRSLRNGTRHQVDVDANTDLPGVGETVCVEIEGDLEAGTTRRQFVHRYDNIPTGQLHFTKMQNGSLDITLVGTHSDLEWNQHVIKEYGHLLDGITLMPEQRAITAVKLAQDTAKSA